MQPDFAEHFLEMRCKGSGFFRNNKEKTHFFIKNPKIFCFYCTFRIIPCIFLGQNNIFNIYMEQKTTLVETITRGIQEKKGANIVVADLNGIDGAICNYFIICQGSSPAQVEAITESIGDFARKELGEKPSKVAGLENAQWVAMDYGDVLVHVFLPDVRAYYDLEHLWEDANLIQIPDLD